MTRWIHLRGKDFGAMLYRENRISVAVLLTITSSIVLGQATNTFPASGNVRIGTTSPQAKLEVNGNLRFTADSSVQTASWTDVLCGGDYAESVDVTGNKEEYEPGDVMVVDPGSAGSFLKSSEPYSTLVAGIHSTKPGVVGKRSINQEYEERSADGNSGHCFDQGKRGERRGRNKFQSYRKGSGHVIELCVVRKACVVPVELVFPPSEK